MIRWARVTSAALAGALFLLATTSRAQNARAEELFLQGRTLMQEQKYEEACKKFKASYDLDRTATGTLLNLAICHEQIGKNASAWAEFRQVSAESAGKRADRVELADKHASDVRKKLAYAAFLVNGASRTPGLVITLDDEEQSMASAAWGTPVPIDPGKHVLKLSAPDKKPATQAFEIQATTEVQDVTVIALVDAPKPPPIVVTDDSNKVLRIVGIALVGAGVASLGVGTYFGIRAINKNHEAKNTCDPSDQCASQDDATAATNAKSSAKSAAAVANVTVVAGAVLAAAGGVMFFTSSRSSTRASVTMGPNQASVSLSGAF